MLSFDNFKNEKNNHEIYLNRGFSGQLKEAFHIIEVFALLV